MMIEEIDKKVKEELGKLIKKENLSSDEIRTLLAIKNDLKYEEKMKDILKLAI